MNAALQTETSVLAHKRRQLQMRCALQRQELSHVTTEIETQLGFVDRAISIASFASRSPIVIFAALAGAMLIGPWRLVRWASQGAVLFTMARKMQQLVTKV